MDHLGVKVCYIRKWPFFTGKMNEEDDKVALGSFHSVVLAGSRTQSVYTWGCLETKPSCIF